MNSVPNSAIFRTEKVIFFCPDKAVDLKGLSHEMDLAFGDILWLALGLNRWRGHF